MKEDRNVIHLADYITQNAQIDEFNVHKPIPKLSSPESLLGKRAGALAFDFTLVAFAKTTLHSSYAIFINEFFAPFSGAARSALSEPNMGVHLAIFLTLFAGYFVVSGIIFEGSSLGKKIMGLQVINEDFVFNHLQSSHELNFMQMIQRTVGYVLCYLSFGTFFVFHFSSEDRRGLSDYLSNTRTVTNSWLKLMLEHKEYAAEVVTIDINSLREEEAA